jgi:putative membrane protein
MKLNMALVANLLTGLVALIHLYIMLLEMVWWTGPRGRKAFRTTAEFAAETKVLAANQGLYNGFLAAGLIWGLAHPDPGFAWQLKLFFLACVAIAGIYGAATVGRKILFIQTLPAILAILALVIA